MFFKKNVIFTLCMIFIKIFFTALVCCYDNFCQSCCHQCCKKTDNIEELWNHGDLFDCDKADKIIPDSYSNNK